MPNAQGEDTWEDKKAAIDAERVKIMDAMAKIRAALEAIDQQLAVPPGGGPNVFT